MNKWNWLKEYLQKNNISQGQVAEALQWQKTRVSELLCGKRDLPVNKVFLASKFFNIDLEELTKYNSGFSKQIPITNGKKPQTQEANVSLDIIDSQTNGKELKIPPIGTQTISTNILKQLTNSLPQNIKTIIIRGDSMQPTVCDGDMVWVDISVTKPSTDGLYIFSIKGDLFVKRLCFDNFNSKISIISDNSLYPAINIDDINKISTLGKVISICKMIG